ncbi:MAG: hypothetical protein IJ233_07610, partial [Pyramidobacter sp.]|nr:hypothetical protein [Pyramidobacter sp.]
SNEKFGVAFVNISDMDNSLFSGCISYKNSRLSGDKTAVIFYALIAVSRTTTPECGQVGAGSSS